MSGGQRARIALARAVYDYPALAINDATTNRPHSANEFQGTKCFFLDDPCSSADPRVGSVIFSRLFGTDGLLQHGSTIMAIDETSLVFYLRMLRLRGDRPSTKFSFKMLENGVLHDVPAAMFGEDVLARTITELPITGTASPMTDAVEAKMLNKNASIIEESTEPSQTSVEQSYSGNRHI